MPALEEPSSWACHCRAPPHPPRAARLGPCGRSCSAPACQASEGLGWTAGRELLAWPCGPVPGLGASALQRQEVALGQLSGASAMWQQQCPCGPVEQACSAHTVPSFPTSTKATSLPVLRCVIPEQALGASWWWQVSRPKQPMALVLPAQAALQGEVPGLPWMSPKSSQQYPGKPPP